MQLHQFYTRPAVARECWNAFARVLRALQLCESDYWFVEPAAGCGGFYNLLPRRRIGLDIAPANAGDDAIQRADYLQWRPPQLGARRYAVIGNPPFGKRGKLAIDFFNHSAFADFIAFIVPVSFRKYSTHKRLHADFSLVARRRLARDSYHLADGRGYSVNAEFQVWTRLPHCMPDLREVKPAATAHADFAMRQYNNTKRALAVFDAPFDFAVPAQGYQDYTRRETDADDCEKHKQWMLFVARDDSVRRRLWGLDFAALAYDCATAVPGFRKNDVVRFYDSGGE